MPQIPTLFIYIFVAATVWTFVMIVYGSTKAILHFRSDAPVDIQFLERFGSGCNTKSPLTRTGGASRALEVSVRGSEVWIRGILPIFTYIGFFYGLTHRIRKESIKKAEVLNGQVIINFIDDASKQHELQLKLKNANDFIKAIDKEAHLND